MAKLRDAVRQTIVVTRCAIEGCGEWFTHSDETWQSWAKPPRDNGKYVTVPDGWFKTRGGWHGPPGEQNSVFFEGGIIFCPTHAYEVMVWEDRLNQWSAEQKVARKAKWEASKERYEGSPPMPRPPWEEG